MTLARLGLCAERINEKHNDFTLLDVGCRTMDLKPLLKGCKEYSGTDITPAEGVFQCDLEEKLPFEDNSFDVVTILDVLEHLDRPHEALQEIIRVANKSVIFTLPNMYYITFRKNYLLGKGISGKYTFPAHPIIDRHRWVLSYDEAINFTYTNCADHGIEYEMILPTRGRTKLVTEPLERKLANKWPNLFCYGVLFEITLNK